MPLAPLAVRLACVHEPRACAGILERANERTNERASVRARPSAQRMRVVSDSGELVSGGDEQDRRDVWVLERYVGDERFTRGWRYCAALR